MGRCQKCGKAHYVYRESVMVRTALGDGEARYYVCPACGHRREVVYMPDAEGRCQSR
jgi:hypothetical protein